MMAILTKESGLKMTEREMELLRTHQAGSHIMASGLKISVQVRYRSRNIKCGYALKLIFVVIPCKLNAIPVLNSPRDMTQLQGGSLLPPIRIQLTCKENPMITPSPDASEIIANSKESGRVVNMFITHQVSITPVHTQPMVKSGSSTNNAMKIRKGKGGTTTQVRILIGSY
jgi:hypothetical protein